ncbi:MAG TPA: BLUF domain-containing protein [Burkholderiaceae bacterium]|nr:BLUF domain-containing protein [Burkholderiaceae bacterium]
MDANHELHIVYLSHLAPGCDYTVYSEVCRSARARNPTRGIAGVLLFDGHRFVQWVYGQRDAVRALMGAIVIDPRHTAMSVRLEAMLPALDQEPSWRTGFISADALDAFAALRRGESAALLADLARLIEEADLEPPLPVEAPPAAWTRRAPG